MAGVAGKHRKPVNGSIAFDNRKAGGGDRAVAVGAVTSRVQGRVVAVGEAGVLGYTEAVGRGVPLGRAEAVKQ